MFLELGYQAFKSTYNTLSNIYNANGVTGKIGATTGAAAGLAGGSYVAPVVAQYGTNLAYYALFGNVTSIIGSAAYYPLLGIAQMGTGLVLPFLAAEVVSYLGAEIVNKLMNNEELTAEEMEKVDTAIQANEDKAATLENNSKAEFENEYKEEAPLTLMWNKEWHDQQNAAANSNEATKTEVKDEPKLDQKRMKVSFYG